MIKENNLLTISEFAKLSNITRPNLLYYDQQGILSPISRNADNNYRFYDFRQLDQAYLITFLRKMGVSIKAIRSYLLTNSINDSHDLLNHHLEIINQEINQLENMHDTMLVYKENLNEIEKLNIPCFKIQEYDKQFINLSPTIKQLEAEKSIDTIHHFFNLCKKKKIDYHGHLGRLFLTDDYQKPDHIFFRNQKSTEYIDAGKYLVYYTFTNGEDLERIYSKIKQELKTRKLIKKGITFEDYPLMGLSISKNNSHLIRIAVKIA